MIRADFNRRACTATALGITVQNRKTSGYAYPLCRALVAAGVEDAPIEFYDETGQRCFSISSIIGGAKRTIVEDDRGIRTAKYVPFNRDAVSST